MQSVTLLLESKETVIFNRLAVLSEDLVSPCIGLINAAPGRRNSTLQNSAKQVENMVRSKMEQREYIILCLEDSNDWSNATTRRLVMQVGANSPPRSSDGFGQKLKDPKGCERCMASSIHFALMTF